MFYRWRQTLLKHVLSWIKVNLFAIFHPVIAEVLPTALNEENF